jgi:hypothetical protein
MKKIKIFLFIFALLSTLYSVQIQFVGEVFTESW